MARLIDPSAGDKDLLATSVTDATGTFHLEVKGVSVASVAVSAEGHLPSRSLELSGDEEITIALEKLTPRKGRVHSSGKPVANALVSFLDENYEILASSRTGADGSYSSPAALGWATTVCVTHPGFAPTCQAAYSQAGLTSADITLSAGKSVEGRVIDESGKPFAQAVVRVDHWPLARSSDDGSFTIPHAPDATTLIASGRGKVGTTPLVSEATIKVTSGRTLTGTVTDSRGRALAGVPVLATGSSTESWLGTITDSKGTFGFAEVVPDRFTVGVTPPVAWRTEAAEVDLRQASGKASLVVNDASFIRGIVVDESKKPVDGAIVGLFPNQMPVLYGRLGQFPFTLTSFGGKFRLPSWDEEGGALRLVAMKQGYAAGTAAVSGKGTLSITLPAGVEISGTVVDSEGKPQMGASVVAAESTQMLNALPLAAAVASGSLSEWTKTDAAGKFAMRVNPGAHDFSVWKRGFAAVDVGGVQASARSEPLRIVISQAAEIRGRVVKKDGTASSAGGNITAMRTDGTAGAGQANLETDGSFVLDSLVAGPYMVSVQSAEGTAVKMIDAPARDVVIELPPLTRIAGRVTDKATGAAVQSFTVITSNMQSQHYRQNEVANASGEFTANVPIGSLDVEIAAPGFAKAAKTITVASKPVEGLNFVLERGRRITGRVTGENGAAVEHATIELGTDQYAGSTEEDGSFELEGVPVNEATLSISGPGHLTATRKVPAGTEDLRIDVELSPGRKLKGTVVDASGAGVADVMVTASSQAHGADYQSAKSGSDGAFILSGLVDAHYDLTARKDGAGQASLEDVDVKTSKPVVLRLVANATGTIHGLVDGAAGGEWMMGMVHAQGASGESASAQVNRDGTYRMENVPAGEVEVAATLTAPNREITSRKVQATVPAGADIELNLPPAGSITMTGRVTSGGSPLASQSVLFSTIEGYGRWRAMTDENGGYAVSGLQEGRYWIQVSQNDARDSFRTQYEVTRSGTYDINITRTSIEGRVVDEAGSAISGATVSLASTSSEYRGENVQATTDESGHFSLELSASPPYQVTAAMRGFVNGTASLDAHSTLSSVVITLRRGAGQIVTLADARNGATLTGYVVVTDESGKITIPVSPEKQENGSLHLALPDGRYRISASASEYASRSIRVSVPSPPIRMTLTPGGTLIVLAPSDARHLVRLVLPDGEEYVRCYCNGIAEIRLEGATTTVPNVAAGSYRMDLLDSSNRVVRSYPVTIGEGTTTTVDATK